MPKARNATAVHVVTTSEADAFLSQYEGSAVLIATGFTGAEGQLGALQGRQGVESWVLGIGEGGDRFAFAVAAQKLPPGTYKLGTLPRTYGCATAALAWLMGGYRFLAYKRARVTSLKLVTPPGVNAEAVRRVAESIFFARDLINTPANDMGPGELESAARRLARQYNASVKVVSGSRLRREYPLVAAVGNGSTRKPRMIELQWGQGPLVTLVGKGVCFDAGGYDLKSAAGMLTMKKDMGGAAAVLALARMVMGAKLRLRLRVLIPAVENLISGEAMRPGDIISGRNGLSVEIGNTDAEGRLILADALADADALAPELLIDIATLTSAARIATGFEVSPYFTDDEVLAADLSRLSAVEQDPLWRLPLWRGYEDALTSTVADLNNKPAYDQGGAITAALFLNRFVNRSKTWVHFDIPAWIDRPKAGRPIGGEANAVRALFALLQERYG